MNIVCRDLEGVLVPEIWIAFSEASGSPELRRTTRDEPDYTKLMNWRMGILREQHNKVARFQRDIVHGPAVHIEVLFGTGLELLHSLQRADSDPLGPFEYTLNVGIFPV